MDFFGKIFRQLTSFLLGFLNKMFLLEFLSHQGRQNMGNKDRSYITNNSKIEDHY